MQNLYGIWIDHAHAFIIKSNKSGTMEITELQSGVEAHHKSGTNSEHSTMSDQRSHNERRNNQMHSFSKEIIKMVQNPLEIVVFGPGNSKYELKHEIENQKSIAKTLKGVETTDKLKEHEMKKFVEKFFVLPRD